MSNPHDCLFPSSNNEGIADLPPSMQGDFFDYPLAYGSVRRDAIIGGGPSISIQMIIYRDATGKLSREA